MQSEQKCVAIIQGTEEVHRPLFQSLSKALSDPVYLVRSNKQELLDDLLALAKNQTVWVLPSNEVTLNVLYKVLPTNLIHKKIIIPGTAKVDRIYYSHELSDKSILHSLMKDISFRTFETVKTSLVFLDQLDANSNCLRDLRFPLIVKPTTKDERDSFTLGFPSKILVAHSLDDLLSHLFCLDQELKGFSLMIQESIPGKNVSWFGRISGQQAQGVMIESLVKSPVSAFGGTTTLARLRQVDDKLSGAVSEIAALLGLDGLFEIEFILSEGRLFFFYEINPRPILQASILLQLGYNVFADYLKENGFESSAIQENEAKGRSRVLWGSAHRYLNMNHSFATLSLRTFVTTAWHDVRFTNFFSIRERVSYAFLLLKLIFRTVVASGG